MELQLALLLFFQDVISFIKKIQALSLYILLVSVTDMLYCCVCYFFVIHLPYLMKQEDTINSVEQLLCFFQVKILKESVLTIKIKQATEILLFV